MDILSISMFEMLLDYIWFYIITILMGYFVPNSFNMCSVLNNHSLILHDKQILIFIRLLLLTTDFMLFIVSEIFFQNKITNTLNYSSQNHDNYLQS